MLEMARGGAHALTKSQTQYIGSAVEGIAGASVLGLSLPFLLAVGHRHRWANSSCRGPFSAATWLPSAPTRRPCA